MISEALPIFIGYDAREARAFEICRDSLLRHSSTPLHIVKLDEMALRQAGLYGREWRQEGNNRVDLGDLRPFSTDFAFTRFFVPSLSLFQGWALFCDCDFLFTADISEIFDLADERFAVLCVKHEHNPAEASKMGGIAQGAYRRKNWSSLVLWNCAHPANRAITHFAINARAGAWLHAFSWLRDDEIGSIPHRWNWLAGVDDPPGITPSGIHYTLGIPGIHDGCDDTPFADLWLAAAGSEREAA